MEFFCRVNAYFWFEIIPTLLVYNFMYRGNRKKDKDKVVKKKRGRKRKKSPLGQIIINKDTDQVRIIYYILS